MATKQAGCLGAILSTVFTSVVAPILVGIALHGLNAGGADGAPGLAAAAGVMAWVGRATSALPGCLRQHTTPAGAPAPTARAPAAVDWTRPTPLGR